MTPEEQKKIGAWGRRLTAHMEMTCLGSDDPRAPEIEAFCEAFSRLAPRISIRKESAEPDSLPGIRIGGNWVYHGVPLGRELDPFLEAIALLLGPPAEGRPSVKRLAHGPPLPAFLKVFVTPECPFCPAAVRELLPLCASFLLVQVAVVDGARFAELAAAHGIRSVPTLILDGGHRWTGTIRMDEILEVLMDRDPSNLSPRAFERMLKEGDAGRLAELMRERRLLFPGFLELLFHGSWPVRMGAMVVMEELSATHPDVTRGAAAVVEARFEGVEDAVKGDLLYVLGELRDVRSIPWLQHILSGPYAPEVKEAAAEAIEKVGPSVGRPGHGG